MVLTKSPIDHPPYNPDINAIEFVWKCLKDYFEKQQPKTQRGSKINNQKWLR